MCALSTANACRRLRHRVVGLDLVRHTSCEEGHRLDASPHAPCRTDCTLSLSRLRCPGHLADDHCWFIGLVVLRKSRLRPAALQECVERRIHAQAVCARAEAASAASGPRFGEAVALRSKEVPPDRLARPAALLLAQACAGPISTPARPQRAGKDGANALHALPAADRPRTANGAMHGMQRQVYPGNRRAMKKAATCAAWRVGKRP